MTDKELEGERKRLEKAAEDSRIVVLNPTGCLIPIAILICFLFALGRI